jgi:hypothetical protein
MFKEIVDLYSESQPKPTSSRFVQNVKVVNVKLVTYMITTLLK